MVPDFNITQTTSSLLSKKVFNGVLHSYQVLQAIELIFRVDESENFDKKLCQKLHTPIDLRKLQCAFEYAAPTIFWMFLN